MSPKTYFAILWVAALTVMGITQGYAAEQGWSAEEKAIIEQGGVVHVLVEVDVKHVIEDFLQAYEHEVRRILRKEKIGYRDLRVVDHSVEVAIRSPEFVDRALELLTSNFEHVSYRTSAPLELVIALDEAEREEIPEAAILGAVAWIRASLGYRLASDTTSVRRVGNFNLIVVQFPAGYGPDSAYKEPYCHWGCPRPTLNAVDKGLFENDIIPAGIQLLPRMISLDSGDPSEEPADQVAVQRRPLLSWADLRYVEVIVDKNGNPEIHLKLSKNGFDKFQGAVGTALAVVFKKMVIATPIVTESFRNRVIVLNGQFSLRDANKLAAMFAESMVSGRLKMVRQWVTPP
jgi:preprotein translocase subunit SecD